MQFQIIAQDFTDGEALNRRLAAREAHLKLGDVMRDKGELLFGAAHLDDSGKMIGSTMIVEFPSEVELNAWLKIEPYMTGKVWEKFTVTLCRVGPSFAKTKPTTENDHKSKVLAAAKKVMANHAETLKKLAQ